MRREYQSRSKVSGLRPIHWPGLSVLIAVWLVAVGFSRGVAGAELAATLPKRLTCSALQTAGLHDYAGAPEDYEPSTFFESKFKLAINKVLMQHLAPEQSVASNPTDLFLTMLPRNDEPIELRCRQVQGAPGELGFSCVNTPPSELILINANSLRFTRSSIGGWVFGSAPIDPTASSSAQPANEGVRDDLDHDGLDQNGLDQNGLDQNGAQTHRSTAQAVDVDSTANNAAAPSPQSSPEALNPGLADDSLFVEYGVCE